MKSDGTEAPPSSKGDSETASLGPSLVHPLIDVERLAATQKLLGCMMLSGVPARRLAWWQKALLVLVPALVVSAILWLVIGRGGDQEPVPARAAEPAQPARNHDNANTKEDPVASSPYSAALAACMKAETENHPDLREKDKLESCKSWLGPEYESCIRGADSRLVPEGDTSKACAREVLQTVNVKVAFERDWPWKAEKAEEAEEADGTLLSVRAAIRTELDKSLPGSWKHLLVENLSNCADGDLPEHTRVKDRLIHLDQLVGRLRHLQRLPAEHPQMDRVLALRREMKELRSRFGADSRLNHADLGRMRRRLPAIRRYLNTLPVPIITEGPFSVVHGDPSLFGKLLDSRLLDDEMAHEDRDWFGRRSWWPNEKEDLALVGQQLSEAADELEVLQKIARDPEAWKAKQKKMLAEIFSGPVNGPSNVPAFPSKNMDNRGRPAASPAGKVPGDSVESSSQDEDRDFLRAIGVQLE